MADLTVTPANVRAGNGAKIVHGTANAAITAGQVVYRDPTTLKCGLADANSATPAVRTPYGVALHAAALDQPLAVLTEGPLNPGATVVVGQTYVLSATPGGIAPVADLLQGDYVSVLGIGTTASNIAVAIQRSGVAVP